MAPEVSIKHANAFQANLFSLPLPVSDTHMNKRKSKELNPEAPEFKRKKPNATRAIIIQEPSEVITIDSDTDVENTSSHNDVDNSSDIESVKICESENETIEVNDSDDGDLVININQPENVDTIVDSALGRLANKADVTFFGSGNDVAKKNIAKRIHWTQAKSYPKSWTKEMIRFYTEPCEQNRVFDYQKILSKRKSTSADWWINRADLMGPAKRRRSFEICRKCGKYGHLARECTKVFVCYICGQFNHMVSNCPNTCCLTCGKFASKILTRCDKCDRALKKKVPCAICRQISHEEFMCPSKWRKHLLLDPQNQTLRLNSRRSCYNCAQRGHFGFECPFTPNSPYPLESPLLTTSIDTTTDFNDKNNVIWLTKETTDLLSSPAGNGFFERLSKHINSRIELCKGVQNYVRIVGGEDSVRMFEDELEKLKHNAS